jgi:hypothetical protein
MDVTGVSGPQDTALGGGSAGYREAIAFARISSPRRGNWGR